MLNYLCVRKSSATAHCTTRPTFDGTDPYQYGVRSMGDLDNTDFVLTDNKIANTNGNWVGNSDFVNEDVIMFFGAKFKNVKGGNEFGSDTITFKSNVE